MVIKASAAGEIRRLVQSLAEHDGVAREGAVARLAVIGPRAVPQLLAAYEATLDRGVRAAVLRALEPIGDGRAALIGRQAIRDGGDVALAAVALLAGLLDSPDGTTGTGALDALMSTALDVGAERRVRLAAMATLRRRKIDIRAVDAAIDSRPTRTPESSASPGNEDDAIWSDALDGHLPDDPQALRDVVSARVSTAPLGELRTLVERLRAHEGNAGGGAQAWRALRGSVHQALAMRGSRVALYDLRETLETASTPLPPSFASAIQVLGDSSCLEAIAAAYTRSAADDERWKHLLSAAFGAIAAREKVHARHAVMKRLSARWPAAVNTLSQTRPLPQRASRTSRTTR
jgi:hypothetical protein